MPETVHDSLLDSQHYNLLCTYIAVYTDIYIAERTLMKQVKVLIQLPVTLRAQLKALRTQGYTVSGYIRTVLERELEKGR